MDWRDPKTVQAVEQYLRLLTAFALAVVLIYMLVAQHIDVDTVISVILGILATDRAIMGLMSRGKSGD